MLWHDGVRNTGVTIVYSLVYSGTYKKKSKLRVTGLCVGNLPVTGDFPAQRDSKAENVSIWWRHHVPISLYPRVWNENIKQNPSKQSHIEVTNSE